MNDFRRTGLCLLITAAAWLWPVDHCSAQQGKYLAIDTMDLATAVYDAGVDECNLSKLVASGETYLRLRDTLLNDSHEFGQQYGQLTPMIAYMLGWCHHRRAEITGAGAQVDSSLLWFSRVPAEAPGQLRAYAGLMAGEIRLWRAVSEKFDLLCAGALNDTEVRELQDRLNTARGDFSDARHLLGADSPQKEFAATKLNDVLFELARLYRAVGDLDRARSYYDSIDYSIPSAAAGDLPAVIGDYTRYGDAVVQWEELLLAPDTFNEADVESLISAFAFADGSFRRGAVYLVQALPTKAAGQFEAADPRIPEAEYFRGYAFLDTAVVEDLLHDAVIGLLRKARTSLERFEGLVRDAGFQGDDRLRRLVTRARHMYELLGIADGQSMVDERLASLSREDIKFLIRIAASTVGTPRSRCTLALRRFFELYSHHQGHAPSSTLSPAGHDAVPLCEAGSADTLGRNEALFLRGLVVSMQAEALGGAERFATFDSAAAILDSVSGSYEGEAKYVRARAVYQAEAYESADALLRDLISNYHSVRALYYYGINLRDWHGESTANSSMIFAVMQVVKHTIEAAGTPPEYINFLRSANILLDTYSPYFCDPDTMLDISGIHDLRCPEELSIDSTGPWPELVLYEALAEKSLIRRKFAQDSREELAVYGLPKLWLLPTSRSCSRGSILGLAASFIPDSVHVEKVWQGMVQFIDAGGASLKLDQCRAELVSDGSSIECRESAPQHTYVLEADVDVHDTVAVEAAKNGFYRTYLKYTSDEPGTRPFKETLARTVRYNQASETSSAQPFAYTTRPDESYSFNLAAHSRSMEPPPKLVRDFNNDCNLRDYAYDPKNDRWLAVSSGLNDALLSYADGDDGETISIDQSINLSSAEGIAVDSLGNILIADWGNHRVVALDSRGRLRFTFGGFGVNREANSGAAARLTFPNRVAIERDVSGVSPPRETHILVSDWLGVHKFDSQGRYLDSPVLADRADLQAGSCYEITLDGYGPGSSLRIHSLNERQPRLFKAME